jgi:hypothetical protein
MPRVYGYVRPYPGRLGKQVKEFVEDQGFELGPGMVVAAGATDAYASRWIMRATMDLLVLPFHVHRGDGGQVLDAIGVLLSLPEDVNLGELTVLMPVRAFSWGSSFQRRLDLLQRTRPQVADRLIIAHQDEIGSDTLAARLRRSQVRSASTGPAVASPTMPPPTLRDHSGLSRDLIQNSRSEEYGSASWPVSSPPAASGLRLKAGVGEVSLAPVPLSTTASSGPVDPTPESARDSFRRAAEIGAKARRETAERKKGR